MDIEYLLLLQNFRNVVGDFFNSFFAFITNIAVDYYIILIPLIIYWVSDKKKGMFIYCTYGVGNLINAFLKVTFCVYRPFIKDTRVKPLESVLAGATGYSFPSGHATCVSSTYIPLVNRFKKHTAVLVMSIIMIALTMFSRNYVGVHTPQDVLVGLLTGFVSLGICLVIEKYIEAHPNHDKFVLLLATIITLATVAYVYFKSYPMDYVNGELLVDPNKMRINSFTGPGLFYGTVWAWYLERKISKINIEGTTYQKTIRAVVGALLVVAYYTIIVSPISKLANNYIVYFLMQASIPLLFMIVYPLTWKRNK